MHAVVRRQDHRATRCKRESYQIGARYGQRCRGARRDFHNAATAVERGCYIKVTVCIYRQPLRTAQSTVKDADFAMGIDFVNRIKAGGGWAGDKKISIVAKGEMIGRYTRLEHGKHEN